MVVAAGHFITHVLLPFGEPIQFGFAGLIVAVLAWLIGITNAINFMDGLDDLASGLTAIIAIWASFSAKGLPSELGGTRPQPRRGRGRRERRRRRRTVRVERVGAWTILS